MISIVTMTHNRGIIRLDNLLKSLEWQTLMPDKVVVVDTGTLSIQMIKGVCEKHKVTYLQVPMKQFNMGLAFNLGIQECESDYVATCPVDMAYSPEFIERASECVDNWSFVLAKCGYLPYEFNIDALMNRWGTAVEVAKQSEISEKLSPGAFQCFPRWWLNEMHGYNEIFTGPDGVDVDIIVRARKYGLEEKWLEFDESTQALHQYHERSELKGVGSEKFTVDVPVKVNVEGWGKWR